MRDGRFDTSFTISAAAAVPDKDDKEKEAEKEGEKESGKDESEQDSETDSNGQSGDELDPSRVDDHGFFLDFDYALEQARKLGKPLLVDFNGRFCVPCRQMERTVFTLPEVEELFEGFVIVSILTDIGDPVANELWEKYKPSPHAGVPYYAILDHDAEVVRGIGSTLPASERGHEFVSFLNGDMGDTTTPGTLPPEAGPQDAPEDWPEGLHPPLPERFQEFFEFTPAFTAESVKPGGKVTLELRVSMKEGDSGPYSMYHPDSPHSQALGMSLFRIEDFDAGGLIPAGDWQYPEPKVREASDALNFFDDDEWKFYGDFVVTRTFTVPADASEGAAFQVQGGLVGQYCDFQGCYWFIDMAQNPFGWFTSLTANSDGVAEALTEPSMDTQGQDEFAPPTGTDDGGAVTTTGTGGGTLQEQLADRGLILLLLGIFALGMVTLLTPCVLPVLPLTIGFFVKQAEQGRSALLSALIYCSCIVFTFTFFGLLTSLLLGAMGPQIIATNGFVNIAIGLLFLFLALSFFGAFELQMPGFVRSWISKKQMGAQQKGRGYFTALLSGGSFSVISFSCTGPIAAAILAGVAGSGAASGGEDSGAQWLPLLAMLAFSMGLAAPIFVLGQFPSLLNKVPKSGGWMNALKVTFAFIEVAIAVRYFAWADIYFSDGIYPAFITREITDAIWIACFLGAGLYLLGLFRLSHDHEPVERLGTTRTLIAISFLAFAVWMVPGLVQGKPMGLMDGFMPPREVTNFGGAAGGGGNQEKLDFTDDLEGAIAQSKETGVPVFVDFTGEICANCRWVETNIFPREQVHTRLRDNFILVHQWTDRRGEEGRLAREQYERYAEGGGGVPMYVIVDGEGNTVEKFVPPQFINSLTADQFAEFLDRGLEKYKAAQR
jgi:thiol:disulfide interchange protein